MAWAGRPGAGQDAVSPPLERGWRRGGLLIAGELRHERGRERGPAGELSLERCHGGNRLRCSADPQNVGFVLVIDGRVKDLYEEGRQRVVPTDDHRQVRVLCGEVIATHRHLHGCWMVEGA